MIPMIHRVKAWDKVIQELQQMQTQGDSVNIEFLLKLMSDISYLEYQKRTKPEDVKEVLSDFVNSGMGSEIEKLADHIVNDHRTLQQSTFRLFKACVDRWADAYDKGYYDARNEETCKQSKEISKLLEDSYLPFI